MSLKQILEAVLCKWCASTVSEEHNNAPFFTKCCAKMICRQCVNLSQDIQKCVICKSQNQYATKDNNSGYKLDGILMKANLSLKQVIKYQLRIGFWPKQLGAEFHQQWLPSFDEMLGIFQQQISEWAVQFDQYTQDHNLLEITFSQPYLFTKFLFAMEGKVFKFGPTYYVIYNVNDENIYASDWFRQKLRQSNFDLVCVPYGQTLEPLSVMIQGLEYTNETFVMNCNLHRASVQGSVRVNRAVIEFTFSSAEDLKTFDSFVQKHGVRGSSDSEMVQYLAKAKNNYNQYFYIALPLEEPPIVSEAPVVPSVASVLEDKSEISSVTQNFVKNKNMKLQKTYGRGQRNAPDFNKNESKFDSLSASSMQLNDIKLSENANILSGEDYSEVKSLVQVLDQDPVESVLPTSSHYQQSDNRLPTSSQYERSEYSNEEEIKQVFGRGSRGAKVSAQSENSNYGRHQSSDRLVDFEKPEVPYRGGVDLVDQSQLLKKFGRGRR